MLEELQSSMEQMGFNRYMVECEFYAIYSNKILSLLF